MGDIFTKEKRSQIMSLVRGKGTRLEEKGFSLLKLAGLRFRKHPNNVFGRPDAANKSRGIAVFIDSDFWHGYKWNRKDWRGRSNRKFWIEKIERNMKRDRLVNAKLKRDGWTVIRIWEHDLAKNPEKCLRRIKGIIESKKEDNPSETGHAPFGHLKATLCTR